jgi:hypothetical protein
MVDIDNVEKVLLQLHELDPTAENFRYSKRRDGSPSLAGMKYIHLRRFHEAMERVAYYLASVDNALREQLHSQTEHDEAQLSEHADSQSPRTSDPRDGSP